MGIPESRPPLNPPKTSPHRFNRVDAYPHLITYHDPSLGPKPTPTSTHLLPSRTLVPKTFLDEMTMAQSHAFYEEIDTVPAAAAGVRSRFEATGGGHWYIVHPLGVLEVRGLSTRVLVDIGVWIEGSGGIYAGAHAQVEAFRRVRAETLALVKTELGRRGGEGRVGLEEGYLGGWEDVGGEVGDDRCGREGERPKIARAKSSTMTEAGLRAADEMAAKMVEEAQRMERWLNN